MTAIHSMTGFGAASRETEDYRVDVELRTVNNRFLKFITKVPEELAAHQLEIEKSIKKQVSRGTIYCTVRFTVFGEAPSSINWDAVNQYYKECQGAIHSVPMADAVTIDTLLNLPGVTEPRRKNIDQEHARVAQEVVSEALFNLLNMRKTEGGQLKEECVNKKNGITKTLGKVKKLAPGVADEYRDRLTERINELMSGSGVTYTSEEFAKEVALFADRSNIDEEIDRMASHLSQFETILNDGGVVGRNLEFLVQEMFREANTMSSKSQNIELVRLILQVKSGIDKLREQVANFE